VKPFWHPISTVFIVDPWCLATPTLLRMLLRTGGLTLRYAGDRMAPAVAHGDDVIVRPADEPLQSGEVVVALHDGVVDLLRVAEVDGERVRLTADADAALRVEIGRSEILARTEQPRARPMPRLRRALLDLREALAHRVDIAETDSDAADSVLEKYDYQAPFYGSAGGPEIAGGLLEWIRSELPSGLPLLVVGSGAGRECMALHAAGWRVEGIDFSPTMVRLAREEAERREFEIEFRTADVRTVDISPGSFAAIVFTYDVYSFLPGSGRVETLRRMRGWLDGEGKLFLSARRRSTLYERTIVELQRWSSRHEADHRRGDSHTRWIAADGSLRRSFVHLFSAAELDGEVRAAGFRPVEWRGGHLLLSSRGSSSIE